MSILLEVVVGAVLSVLVSTGEVDKKKDPEKVKTEQLTEAKVKIDCKENL